MADLATLHHKLETYLTDAFDHVELVSDSAFSVRKGSARAFIRPESIGRGTPRFSSSCATSLCCRR